VSARHQHATAADCARAAATLKARRTDEAARRLLATIVAEGELRIAGRDFLDAAEGLDQRAIVKRAAEQLREKIPNALLSDCTRVVWEDCGRLFGWHDLDNLEVGGSA
jgi:hypothetical protein